MLDAELCFTLQTNGLIVQSISSSGPSTNVIDLNAANLNLGNPAKPMYLIGRVTVLGTGIGTSLEVKLENSAAEGMSSEKEIWTRNILAEKLIAGALIVNDPLPMGIWLQYLRLDFDMIGGDSTITVMFGLSDAPEPYEALIDSIEA